MAAMGFCPSGRLFEAAACGAAIVTDGWNGLGEFFTPGEELVVARDAADVLAALDMPRAESARMAARARAQVLDCHTADRRATELEEILSRAADASAGAVAKGARACSA